MIIATKLLLPPTQPGLVNRPRLFDALDNAKHAGHKLILISAPPGYGKTTLLAEWIHNRSILAAWISLNDADNDPVRFFRYLILGLKDQIPGLEDLLTALNTLQTPDLEALTIEVINALVVAQNNILLVMDDYHVLHTPQNHALVQYLLDHQPPQLQLALVTRHDPPLNLPLLRARRQLCEIRQRDLSFNIEEVNQLMQEVLQLDLSSSQINALASRTEGWAVGLHLAALSLRDSTDAAEFVQNFSGSHRYIIDYLAEEILSNLPDDLRDFLQRSAALDRFCPNLLDAALNICQSREMLSKVEAANLFLVPLDNSRTWFRYHHLMSDILRSKLAPQELHTLQSRAARWLIANKHAVESVQYAFKTGDQQLACALIRQAAIPVAESGQLGEVLRWMDALNEDVLLADIYLSVLRAWFLIYNGRFHEAAQWVQQLHEATSALEDMLVDPKTRPLAGLVMALQTWMQSTQGLSMDPAHLEKAYTLTSNRFSFLSPLILLALGQALISTGRSADARAYFEEGMALAENSGKHVTALILRNNLAFLLNNLGERTQAITLCREGVASHSVQSHKPGLLAGIPMLALGCILYQSGELQEASSYLTQSLNLVQRLGLYDVLASPANQSLQFLLSDQGKHEEALSLNRENRLRAAQVGLPAVAAHMDLLAAWLHYFAGDAEPAYQWINSHPLQGEFASNLSHLNAFLLHMRIKGESGKGQEALDILKELEELTQTSTRKLDWIRVKIEQAIVWHQMEQTEPAKKALQAALQAAAPMHYRQRFIQEYPRLAPLLENLRPQFPDFIDSICSRRISPEQEETVLIDPPTEREMEILRLVAAGLSNAGIAERLYITVGTTKWHLNHLYAKLGVNRRTEAVAKARQLGLI